MRRAAALVVLGLGCGDSAPPAAPATGSTTLSFGDEATSNVLMTTAGQDSTDSDAERMTSTGDSSSGSTGETGDTTGGSAHRLAFEPIALPKDLYFGTAIAWLPYVPGAPPEFLLLTKKGEVHHFALQADTATELGWFQIPNTYSLSDCGAVSLVLDPEFATNRLAYVGMCFREKFSGIKRMRLDPEWEYEDIPDTLAVIIEEGDLGAPQPWHNIGDIGFYPDGVMWAVFGEKFIPTHAQYLGSNLGGVVRILPDKSSPDGGYAPAPDNPFIDDPRASPDLYAWGLRSPWTAVLDAKGRLFIGDVGLATREEVNMLTEPGTNFGWPMHEGPCLSDCDGLTDPIRTWRHGPGIYINEDPDVVPDDRRVGWVGGAYDASQDDRYNGLLTDRILFGDACLGYVRGLEVDDDGEVVFDQHLAHLAAPSSWTQAPDGYLYALVLGRCGSMALTQAMPPAELYRVVLQR